MELSKKPSEKILENHYDGKELIDRQGRIFKLRKPNILDKYDLFSALGDDAKNPMCLSYAIPLLHILMIDGALVECPKSYREFRATLARIGDDGIDAFSEFMSTIEEDNTEKGQLEKAKK